MKKKTYKPRHEIEAAEPRLLFSAGLEGVLAAQELADPVPAGESTALEQTLPPSTSEGEAPAADEQGLELIFVDSDTPEYRALLDDLLQYPDESSRYEVIVLDNTADGIEQITAALDKYTNLSAVHILSHGTDGAIDLGGSQLDADTLAAKAEQVSSWSNAFSESGDLLIYGCDLAASSEGQMLVNSLATLTGADVAASDDLTGNAALGGDWELEYSSGSIESSIAISSETQGSWTGLLAFNVDTTADTNDANPGDSLAQDGAGNTSLRAAIEESNALAGADDIILGAGNFTLGLGELQISSDINIIGAGVGQTVIDANSLSRVFEITSGTITISNLTITGGSVSGGGSAGDGGGLRIASVANVTLSNVSITGNTASGDGAGIANQGTLVLDGVSMTLNTADRGGAVNNTNNGTVQITNSTLSGNTADSVGGAIRNVSVGSGMTLTNVTISGNTVTSGVGGGIENSETMTLANVTITNNSASTGSGIRAFTGTTTLQNTIVAGNTGSADLAGTFVSNPAGGSNLVGDVGTAGGFTDGVNGDQVGTSGAPIDPLLGALADNGGPTMTHALLAGSTAINAGTSTGAPVTDQRGTARDASIDIGAYEFAINSAPVDLQTTATIDGGIALNADGGNDVYLLADNGGALLGGLTTVTIETSFSIDTPAGDITPLLSYADGTNDEELGLFIKNDGRIWFMAHSPGAPYQSTTASYSQLFDGEQHHVAVSWNSTSGAVAFYVDGVQVETFTGYQTGQSLTGGGELVFGQDQDSILGGYSTLDVFSGSLYDVRIFNDIRTTTEIAAGFDQTLPSTEPGMIANWTFSDLSGGMVTEAVSGNNLTEQHVSGAGFTASNPELTLAVREDAANGHVIGGLTAVDPDSNETFTYSLLDNAGGRFSIDSSSGQLSVADASLIDYESAASHNITVRVTDFEGLPYDEIFTISVVDANDAPINSIPVAQNTNEDTALVFSTGNGNLISVGDVDSSSSPLQVTLTATNGTITLSQIDGLSFSVGTGTGDGLMTFTGTTANINTALDGLSFLPNTNYFGAADIQIQTSDLGSSVYGNETVYGTSTTVGDYDKQQIGTQVTIGENGTITGITAYLYIDKPEDLRFGLYTDVAGEPGALVVESSVSSHVAGTGWYTVELPPTAVTAGTYWLAMDIGKEGAYFFDAAGGQTRHSNYDPAAGLATPWTGTYDTNARSISVFASVTPDSVTALSDTDNIGITVNAANDAPTTNNVSASGNEDATSIAITLTGGDIDGTVDNYVLNALPANGTLYLDAGLTTAVTTATDYAATAEALTLYFVPSANWNGSTNFQFVAKDNNGLVDATPGTATITVNAVNDAPMLGSGVLGSVPVNSSNPPGGSVLDIFSGQFSDPDAGSSLSGVAIIANNASPVTEGVWQYSSDGINWFDIGAVNDGAMALAISATSDLRFVPASGYTGTPAPLVLRGLDNTYAGLFSTTDSGESRINVDTTSSGNSTPVAATSANVMTSVVNADSLDGLWLSSKDNASGTPGLSSWSDSNVVSLTDPNLSFGENTTNGTFSSIFEFASLFGDADIVAIDYVEEAITVGPSAFSLQAGDLLFAVDQTETFGPVTVNTTDIAVFRPDAAGDYSSGTIDIAISNATGRDIRGISVVHNDITVGGVLLQQGDLLLTMQGAKQERNVYHWTTTDAGTPGTIFLDRNGFNNDKAIWGVDLVERTTTVGGVPVSAGQILVTLDADDSAFGTNLINLEKNDVAVLSVTSAGDGTTSASAQIFMDGSDVGTINAGQPDALTLVHKNDAPTTNNVSASGNEDDASIAITLTGGDIDGMVDNYLLNGLPANGTLYLDAGLTTAVTTATDYAATAEALALYFVPNANWNGSTNFQFVAKDNNGLADATPGTATITVNAVNDAPVLTNSGAQVSFTENGAPVIIDSTFTVTDIDSADFNGGLLQVSFSAGGALGDRLSIFDQGTGVGQIGVSGSDVTYGGVVIGAFTGGLNSSDPLIVNLNASADAAAAQALMRNITFWNNAASPATAARTIDFVLSDGDGGTSNTLSQTTTVTTQADVPIAVDDHWGLDFDGTDDYVSIADSASLTMTNTMTMEAWIKADPSTNVNRMIINKEGEYEVALFADGTINWAFANTDPGWTWHNTGYVVPDGAWTHIAVAYDNGAVTTYVDGKVVDFYGGSGSIGDAHATLDELRIGGRSNDPAGKYFDGQIDEVRIWNTARTQAEIQASLDQNLTGGEVGLAGYWSFYEGTGSSITDLTGNGNSGTLVDGGLGAAGPQWTGYITDQDTQINITAANGILSNDIDGNNDPLTVTEVNGSVANVGSMFTLPSGAQLTVGTLGAFIYNPNGAFDYLNAGETGTDTFTYQVDDGNGGTDTATATITITGIADNPTTSGIADFSVNEDPGFSFIDLKAVFDDAEDADTALIYAITNNTNPGLFDATTINGSGVLTLDYAANQNGAATITVRATDTDGMFVETTFTVTVNPVNDLPVATASTVITNEDTAHTFVTGDFSYTDVEGDALVSVTFNNLSLAGGTLEHSGGTAVTNGMTLTAAQIASLVYTPASDANGAPLATFEFTVNDADAGVTAAQMDIDVTPVNDAPTTNNVSASGNEDATSIAITLTGGDIDGTVDNYVLNGLPTNGTLYTDAGLTTLAATATDYSATVEALTLYFVPNANWNGSTNFQFVAKDNNNAVDATPGTATITVNAVNDAPVATASSVTTNEDTIHTFVTGDFSYTDVEGNALVSVTFNNLNLAGGTLEHSGGTAVTNGMTLTAAQIASLVYTPATDANGAPLATFDFTVNDADAGVTAAQMDIDVTPVNDAPTTNNVSASGNEGASSIAITLTGGDIDGTVDNYVLNGLPPNGTLYIDAGLTTLAATATDYAATSEALTLYFVPSTNWNGVTNFQFTAKDNAGLADATPGTATLTVNAVNDAPTTNNVSASGNEDATSIAITLTGGDIDGTVDNYVMSNLPANGTLYLDAGLTTAVATATDYAATAEALTLYFVPNADWNGSTNFQFVAKDNNGAVDATPGTATLTVNAVNDAPTTNNVSASGNEDDASIAITLTGGDIDGTVDNFVLNDLPANGTLYTDAGLTTLAATATDYAATAEALTLYFVPNADWNGSTNFQFVAKDNNGAVDATPGTATLTVNAVNDAPTTNNVSASGNEDDASITITLTGSDIDGTVDNYVLNGLPANGTLYLDAGLTTAVTVATDYAATADALTLYFVPNANWNGVTNFQFVAKDNAGLVDATPGTATLTVNAVNDAPMTNNVSASGNEDDASIAITLTGGDIDGTVDNYVLNGLPANGTLYLDAGLTTAVTTATDYAATAEALTLYFVPNANWNGVTNFQFVAKDGAGLADATPGAATLTVNAVNDAPTTNNVSASGNEDDASIAITLTGGDIDGTVDNYVLNGLPANGTLYLDAGLTTAVTTATDYAATAEALTLYFVPNANWNGSTNFQFVAKDNNGAVDATPGTATLTVNAINDAPTTNNVSASGNEDDASIAITLTGGDIDGTVDNYVLSGLPANGTLYTDAGLTTLAATATDYAATAEALTLYFVPNANWNGSTNFQFVAKDNNGLVDATPGTATLTVNAVNDAPVATANTVTTNEDTTHTFVTGDFSYTDVEGDALVSVTFNNLNLAGGTLEHSGGTAVTNGMTLTAAQIASLVYTPATDANGAPLATFDFTVNDADAGVTAAQMDIDVTSVNDAPTTNNVSASGNEDDASIAITLTGGDIDGTVDNYVLNGLPANGTLYIDAGLTTAAATATDYAATAEALTLYFVPNGNWNGSTNFQFVAKDNNGLVDATPGTATLTVSAINDAPVATASTVITNEDTAHTFVTGDFSYTDVEGDALLSVTFNNLNLAGGTLEHSGGTAVTNGMTLTAAQIATLVYTPATDANGAPLATFDFTVNDADAGVTVAQMDIDVTPVNDAPTTNNVSASGNEDDASIAITLTGGDIDGTVDNYVMSNLPANGTLYLDAGLTTVVATATDYAATAEALTLYFVPNANWNGVTNFQFVAKDNNGLVDATPGTATLTVNAVNDAPTTNNVSASGNEDATSIAITLTGGDIDGTVDNYVLNGLPVNGTLYIDAGLTTLALTATDYAATAEALTLYFVPNANWNGVTNFQFVAKDNNGLVDATPGTATLTINAVNDAPVATANTVTTNEDTTHTFVTGDFSYTDVEGDALVSVTFNNLNLAGGTLEHSGGSAVTNGMTLTAAQIASLVYTPATDANGAPLATFDFTVNDADAGVTAAQMDIDVTPVNDAPTTNNVSASGNEDDASIAITLTGGDIDGTVDNYVLNGLPANGTLYLDAGLTTAVTTATDYAATAEALTLYFVPNANWNGSTNFQFVAKDNNGLVDATPGTATLTVNAVNDAPTTNNVSASGNEDDASIAITLTGGDIDGTVDNFVLNGLPANGMLYLDAGLTTAVTTATDYAATAEALTLYFVPNADWNGSTNFQFVAKDNNGAVDATPGTATLTVNAVNDAATTNNVSASGNEDDASIAITLTGGDIDGTVDNYVLNGLPANGTLYLDAGLVTAVATATDYTATAEALTLYFVPNANWNGSTNFQFVAKDNNGAVDATPGTATLTVNAVNDAPVATASTVITNEDTAHTFVTGDFSYTDVEGDALVSVTFNNLNLAGGTLEHSGGTAVTNGMTLTAAQIASLVYTPASDANGAPLATFDFTVNDADAGVTAAQMDIDVTPVNDAPTTNNVSTSGNEDAASIAITLTGGDIDGTVDNYVMSTLPANGTLYLDAGLTTAVTTATDYAATAEALTLYFVPNTNWNGVTNFQFVAKDNAGLVDATPGTATITVNAVNDAPVATASTVITNEDTAHTFVTGDFSYTDVEGDALVSVTFNNLNLAGGTLEHSGGTAVTNGMTLTAAQIATLVYTPATDANGAPLATFDFTVNDADAGVTAAQMDIDVTPVNDAPTTNNVSASGNEDATSIAITLTGGDIDSTVDNYVLNGLPANGTLYTDAGLTTVAATATDYAATAEALTLYFVPNANWNGVTNFQFVAKDNAGLADATPGTATLTVNAVNDAPTTNNVSASGNEDDASIAITLTGGDIDGTVDNYVLNGLPANGTLYLDAGLTTAVTTATDYAATAEALTLYFVPNANWNGSTNFQFVAKDNNGLVDATPGTAMLTVNAVNDAPTTNNVSATGNEDATSIAIILTGGDIDGTVDNYVLNGLPANGTLYLDAGLTTAVTTATDYAATADALTLYFVPNANWNGSTNFQFTAKDNNGLVDATPGTATLTVNAVNDAPTGAVTIDNTNPLAGDTITASNTLADADGLSGAISYQWMRNGVAIAGETASTYTTTAADVGSAISVVASYVDDQGTAESVSSNSTSLIEAVASEEEIPIFPDDPVIDDGGDPDPALDPNDDGAVAGAAFTPGFQEPGVGEDAEVTLMYDVNPYDFQDYDYRDGDVERRMSDHVIKLFDKGADLVMDLSQLVDLVRMQMSETEQGTVNMVFRTVGGITLSLSAGVVTWLTRGGAIAATMVSSVPVLKGFDPIAIMKTRKSKAANDNDGSSSIDDSVDSMFEGLDDEEPDETSDQQETR